VFSDILEFCCLGFQEKIKYYFERLYSNKFENLEEIDRFLETYNHPKLNQENINHLNRSITQKETETAIKSLPKMKSPGPKDLLLNCIRQLKKN
jgi:hypothetical protein